MDCSTSGFPLLHHLTELAQTHVHRVGDAIQPSHPLSPQFSSYPQSFPASGSFQWVSSSHQVAKVLQLSFSISPSNEYSGLISFRMDWFDLLAVQGTLKSLLQHHSLKASILRCWLSLLYGPTHIHTWLLEKSQLWLYGPLLARCCLLFNTVCHSVSARTKCLNFVASITVCSDFEVQENKVCHCFHFPPSVCHEVLHIKTSPFYTLRGETKLWMFMV